MKLFFGEFKPDYSQYHFPYQVWLKREEGDEVEKIYASGFLPFRDKPGIYYLARSLRVDLSGFDLSSENRRILRKTENITAEIKPLAEFSYRPEVQKLCVNYARERFGQGVMPAPTIKGIFTGGVYNQVFVFKDSTDREVGWAICYLNEHLLQFAHSFYDLSFFKQDLGARMMLEAVIWSQNHGRQYAYLGTCYENKALYKTEFKGVEFFNGFTWSNNMQELKDLIARDNPQYLLRDKEYLKSFYGDLPQILDKYGVRVKF